MAKNENFTFKNSIKNFINNSTYENSSPRNSEKNLKKSISEKKKTIIITKKTKKNII